MFKLALIVCFVMAMTAVASTASVKEGDSIPARIERSAYGPPPPSDNHGSHNSGSNSGSGNLVTGGDRNTYNNFQNADLQGKGVHLTPSYG